MITQLLYHFLRAINKKNNGPVSLVHFDAHLDTWDTYFGAPYTHGTPFRRAREEGLFLDDASMHVGIRGPLYSRDDIKNDESFGFKIIHCDEFQTEGTDKIAERIKKRVGRQCFISYQLILMYLILLLHQELVHQRLQV